MSYNYLIIQLALVFLTLYLPLTLYLTHRKLRHFPGPFLARYSELWLFYQSLRGRLDKAQAEAVRQYGSPCRIGPNLLIADDAELVFDRCVLAISSNLNKPECRGKNVRLWRKSEEHNGKMVDVLMLLFYTSALPEERAHWVEEPHYIFQWLTDEVCKKSTDRVTLMFSREPGRWNRDKLFPRRKSSSASSVSASPASPTQRRDSGHSTRSSPPSPGISSLVRSGTHTSVASAASITSSRSVFGRADHSQIGDLNRFGYNELEIKFQSKSDRKDFVTLWQQYVKQLGSPS